MVVPSDPQVRRYCPPEVTLCDVGERLHRKFSTRFVPEKAIDCKIDYWSLMPI